ncbi:MAG: DNA translocase FtsK [Dysgonamonadaceae bacterium]|jgi:S-DNA-T family DNA segregation ATPase FtsK/SpoIIIE|nr:DNA translocase FtsK [Dysgonamonadaceae bacterium]
MAKRKRIIRKKTSSSRGKKYRFIEFIKSDRTQFIFGLIVAFAGLFMLLAIVSFFFTGAADQSKVLNRSFFELIRDKDLEVNNWIGAGGASIAESLVNGGFGVFSVLIPMFISYIGLRIMKVSNFRFYKAFFFLAYGLICGSIASAFLLNRLFPQSHINWGGAHGTHIESVLRESIGALGVLLLILLFIVVILLLFRRSLVYKFQTWLVDVFSSVKKEESDDDNEQEKGDLIEPEPKEKKKTFISTLFKKKESEVSEISKDSEEKIPVLPNTPTPLQEKWEKEKPKQNDFEIIVPKDEEFVPIPQPETMEIKTSVIENEIPDKETSENEDISTEMEDYDPRKDLSTFEFPKMDLLIAHSTGEKAVDMEEQMENKNKIIATLRNYGIEITSIKATVGPTITLYEIVPQAGVRISKIRNLEDDIALSLSALGIRIIAPMPGKGTIGIEVPNKDPQIVSMQSVVSSKKFQESTADLPVALGKTITNEVFIFDLAKMPHLLVAGATGQGKSVGLNAIITSLLYKKHPSEIKMVLVDPKMVEFNIYSTIEKHYLAKLPDQEKAIITDVSKVTETLNSLTKEMDDRYELLMKASVRTIKEYNEKFVKRRLNPNNGHRYMPYIVVVIDEFGDLIMTAGKEIEMPIARIAQKARAVGMHMIIATQRPTTNIITGTIKANFPARMAFRVTSQIDSRTILDMSGANQLIGRGDMLFSQGSSLIRIQCAFVDTPEVEEISKYIGTQRGYETAHPLPEVQLATGDDQMSSVDMNDRDSLFDEAARLIVMQQQGSTSLIQRKFSIGYNRAGRLMDQIERAGIVGPAQGSKPREVYISDEYSLEKLLDSLK